VSANRKTHRAATARRLARHHEGTLGAPPPPDLNRDRHRTASRGGSSVRADAKPPAPPPATRLARTTHSKPRLHVKSCHDLAPNFRQLISWRRFVRFVVVRRAAASIHEGVASFRSLAPQAPPFPFSLLGEGRMYVVASPSASY
jgi:hypothetical protein